MLKSSLKILSLICLFLALFIPVSYYEKEQITIQNKSQEITTKLSNNTYYGILSIPKINLKEAIYPLNSKENNVNKNLELIKGSTMPDNPVSNIIIAGHSGTGLHAYFKNLYKLEIGEEITFFYNNHKYIYEISEIENQAKTGTLYLKTISNQMLTLITCTKDNKNTQTIYYCKLKKCIENVKF